MSLRRVLALVLLAPLLGPYAASYSSLAMSGGHCQGGICQCGHDHRAVPKPPAPCHGARAASPADCFIKARCNHEPPLLPGTHAVGLIAATAVPASDPPPALVTARVVGALHAGFSRIDSPPPRLA